MRSHASLTIALIACLAMPAVAPNARAAAPLAAAPAGAALSEAPAPAARARILESFGRMPLYFVENQGQVDPRVAYYVLGSD
jgi:hypothetical protein